MREIMNCAIYYEFLAVLSFNPQYFDSCIVKAEHLIYTDIKTIFTESRKLYLKTGEVLLNELITKKGVKDDIVLSLGDYYMGASLDRFNRLQEVIINKYKKAKIYENAGALKSELMDIDEFDYEYKKLQENSLTEIEYLTSSKLLSSCTEENKFIHFTRFNELNTKLKLYEGDFMILAGGTGVGKTALAINLLEDLSQRYDCLYFNMEMPSAALNRRLIAVESRVPIKQFQGYKQANSDITNKINSAINRLSQRKISILNGSQSIEQIKNIISTTKSDHHRVVFIDHIGLIKYSHARSLYEKATEVAKELRRICLDYNCTIIGLCQLSRIQKEDKKPRLSMLRDSGEIEQSARKVMFIWETTEKDFSTYEIVIEKNDSYAKSIIRVDYDKQIQRISEII